MYTSVAPTLFQRELTEARQYRKWQEITSTGTAIIRHIGCVFALLPGCGTALPSHVGLLRASVRLLPCACCCSAVLPWCVVHAEGCPMGLAPIPVVTPCVCVCVCVCVLRPAGFDAVLVVCTAEAGPALSCSADRMALRL